MFGALFALLSIITELVTGYFGTTGLLTLSAVVGVTDIDPYVLSLVRGPAAVGPVLVSAIVVAMMSNTIVKGVYFGTLAKSVRKEAFIRYAIWALLHLPFILIT